MTVAEEHADVGLLEEVPLDAAHEEILLVGNVPEAAGPNIDHADVGATNPSRQLDTDVERDLFASQQADLTTKDRVHIRTG